MIGAPIMGSLADSKGRRPIILLAMTTVTLQYIGYLLAPSTLVFILIRGAAGFLSAGLFPASMGVVADLVPEDRRARWAGIIMGSYAVGMIFGPVIGGLLYDGFGYAADFTGNYLQYGYVMRNLTALQALDVLRRQVLG